MDRLTSLTAFVQVVDNGGFSAAARRLNMSTAMVSNHVQALEDRLGVRLLNRTTRKVSLTEAGKAYYGRCRHILTDLEQADDFVGTLHSTPRGTLRVYTVTSMVPLVSSVVTELLKSYPDVSVDLTMGERTIDLIDEGYDIAIRLTPPPDSSLVVRSLATWRHVLCCSKDYLEKHGRPHQLSDLSRHNCLRHVLYPFEDGWHFTDRKGASAVVKVSGNLITNSGDTLRVAVVQGVGICLAAGFLVHDDLEEGRLVRLLPEYRPVELSLNAVYPHRHHLSAKVRTFIDLLVRRSAEQQKVINPYA
jgi:DNA-binding transcriptional LysR family regulator